MCVCVLGISLIITQTLADASALSGPGFPSDVETLADLLVTLNSTSYIKASPLQAVGRRRVGLPLAFHPCEPPGATTVYRVAIWVVVKIMVPFWVP